MITNTSVTIYHKGFNNETRLETWTRFNYPHAWVFGGESASDNKGYNQTNNVQVRIPYKQNALNIDDFSIGDIIVKGTLTTDITRQQDLSGLIYNIVSIKDNTFGNEPHIHLEGK